MAEPVPVDPLRVERLYLKDVGPFRELDLTFQPKRSPDKADLHILVGPNGSGKSTLLYTLAAMFKDPEDHYHLATNRFRTPDSYAAVHLGDGWFGFSGPSKTHFWSMIPGETEGWREVGLTASRHVYWNGQGYTRSQARVVATFDFANTRRPTTRLSFAAFAYAGQRNLAPYQLTTIGEPTTNPLADALSFTGTADAATIVQWLATSHTKEALALKDGNTAAAERYRTGRRHVEAAIREVVGDDITFDMSYEPLGITLRRGGTAIALDLLPDGMKSIVSWVADLLARLDRIPWEGDVPVLQRSFLLLLDEVDIHLHPAWQRRVMPMVQRLFPNAQIVVSTHSPFVVSSVSDAWVYPFAVKDGVATVGVPLPSQAGTSYGAVLREVFGVPEEFDVETERELSAFYSLRTEVLQGNVNRFDDLRTSARLLSQRGDEVADIVGSEVVQVARRVGLQP